MSAKRTHCVHAETPLLEVFFASSIGVDLIVGGRFPKKIREKGWKAIKRAFVAADSRILLFFG
jgi:hypothetical protein